LNNLHQALIGIYLRPFQIDQFMPGMVAMKPEMLSRMLSLVPQTLAASYRSASPIAMKTILPF
jgi:hypothetical protein